MNFIKRQLPIVIAFTVGMVLWAQYYIPSGLSRRVLDTFSSSWAIIITGCALILGIFSAIHHHSSKIKLKKPGWIYSLITLASFGFTVLVGWFPIPWKGFSATTINDGSFFDWIFMNIYVPLDATMFSLLAFFIASAAFRAFRARSFEATALLIAGCIMMLGRVSLGEMITIPGTETTLTEIAGWILINPNAAAYRGILLGVVLSMVAISLRILFGIERTYMGGGE